MLSASFASVALNGLRRAWARSYNWLQYLLFRSRQGRGRTCSRIEDTTSDGASSWSALCRVPAAGTAFALTESGPNSSSNRCMSDREVTWTKRTFFPARIRAYMRSEEHTSELQSHHD